MNRYETIEKFKTERGKTYITNPIYPAIPESEDDIYIIAGITDRYDVLALEFYNDSSLWWIISSANSDLPQNSYYIPEGKQIRIPQNIASVLSQFKALNGR